MRRRFVASQPSSLSISAADEDRADRVRDVLAGERRRRSVHRLEHRRPARMDVARRRHAEAALQRARRGR